MIVRSFAKILVQRPRTVLLIFAILTVIIGLQISNIHIESDFTKYLPEDDPTVQIWNRINDEFRIGSTIIILVEQTDRYYNHVTDVEVLKDMERVSGRINKYDNDKGEIDGVFAIKSLASLIMDAHSDAGYLKEVPDDQALITDYLQTPEIKKMKGSLYTNTYEYGAVIIQLSENADYDKILSLAKDAVDKEAQFSDMTVTGTIAMQKAIQENTRTNLMFVFPVALILVSIVLFFFHRSVKGIIIAFLPPASALVLTFGFLGAFYPELTIISIAIIALMMGLGVDYSIHLMNRLVEEKTVDDKISRVEKTLRSTGKAVLLSTITTMIGFGALMISSMPPMIAFGFGSAIGILFCFISAIILVPCLVTLLSYEKKASFPSWKKFAAFIVNNRGRVILIAVFFVIMSLMVIPKVETDVSYLRLSPKGIPEVEANYKFFEIFGGSANFNALLVETDFQGLTYYETIEAICDMEDRIREEAGVYAVSYADLMKEYIDTYNLAKDRNVILQKLHNLSELLELFDFPSIESIMLNKIAESGLIDEPYYSKTVIYVHIPVGESIRELEKIINKINKVVEDTDIPHNGYVSHLTGQDAVNVAVNKRLNNEQTRSMIIALILVLGVLILIFASSMYGFLTLIPVAFVLAWEPGFLVAANIPLSVITISIASIMIGIGIDYGIHITQRVKEGRKRGLSREEATKKAIENTGLSLVEAASTTIAGLISIYFISIPALQEFGLIVILMTALSCIAAALILPVFFCSKLVK